MPVIIPTATGWVAMVVSAIMSLCHFLSSLPFPRRTVSCLAALLATATVTEAAHTLIDYSLGDDQLTTRWDALNNTNPGYIPATGTGSLSVDGPAFPAGTGIYSFAGDYGITIAQTAGVLADINTVILQIDAAPAGAVIPVLTYSHAGGTGTLDAMFSGIAARETRLTSSGEGVFENLTFQWDLSGIPESLTGIAIRTAMPAHTSTVAAQVDSGAATNTQQLFTTVPEPSAALFCTLTIGTAGLLRRRQVSRRAAGGAEREMVRFG